MAKKFKLISSLAVLAIMASTIIVPMSASAATTNLFQRNAGLGDLFKLDMLFNVGNDNKTSLGDLLILDKLFPVATAAAVTQPISLATQLSGRILIETEKNGEAWYVDPTNSNRRVYLGTPAMAFSIMSNKALGVSNADFNAFQGKAPSRLSGRFLIKTEDGGTIYYVNPVNMSLIPVIGAAGAANVIKSVGLGISAANIAKITAAQ